RGHRVVRPAELERAHPLQVLGLQQHPAGAGGLVQQATGDDRRAVRDALEPPRRCLDVVERDHAPPPAASRAATHPSPSARAASRSPWRPNAATTSSDSPVSKPDTISCSGTRSSAAATSSSSGRTRLASTTGAHGPPRRTSQRDTPTFTPLP